MSLVEILALLNLLAVGTLFAFWKSAASAYGGEKGKNLATKEDIREITKQIEDVKSQYSFQLERIRLELSHAGNVYRYQYETELGTYREMWEQLVEVQAAVQNLRPMVDVYISDKAASEKRDQDRLNEFANAFNRFTRLVHKHRPFYPAEVFSSFKALFQLAHGEAIEVAYKDAYERADYWKSARSNAEAINTQVDAICEAIRLRLARTGVA